MDQSAFRRILFRNIALPLVSGIITIAAFIGLIIYLLSVLHSVEQSEHTIGSAHEVAKLSVDMESGMRGFLLTGDEDFLEPYKVSVAKLNVEMNALVKLVSDNPMQLERLKRIAAMQEQWIKYAQKAIQVRRANGNYTQLVQSGDGKAQFDSIREEFTAFLNVEQRERQQHSNSAENVTFTAVAGFLLLSLVMTGLLALMGRRELMQLSNTYNETLQQQTEHAEKLQRLAWLRSGQTQLAEHGIGHLTLAALGNAALEFLARYLNAAVGTLYVREDDATLRRVAAYGFDQKDEQYGRSFQGRDSLVGQAALERRVLQLNDVPDNYLKVSSGLGNITPNNVVIVPVDNDGVVNGVIELGFLHHVSERDLDLLKLVSSNIGTSVEAARARQRLQDVLAETQQLNEELQVQQEELRTSNEELEEQSRVLEESQVNLENQKAELEQINQQLADQAITLDQKNISLNEVQLQLEERAEDLQRASRYKSEFLANMSHELRTPLNSSLILAKLLSENSKGNLTDEQVNFAQTIYAAGNDLLNLINDILDISKVEAGKLDLNPENVTLRNLAESLQMTFTPLATQKQLEFCVQIAPGTRAALHTDHQRLEQILKNLLSNAIKFTESGKVTLDISQDTASDSIRFAVQDSGIGIPEDQQEIIFEAFRQADGTTSRRYGGTGLGLSISHDLATLLGGTITVNSVPNEGSTFTLVVPIEWCAPAEPEFHRAAEIKAEAKHSISAKAAHTPLTASTATPPPEIPSFDDDRLQQRNDQRSVLVVEDDPEFAHILYDLAHEMGYRCLVAHGAEDGLALASTHLPDAILLDMGLPDRSGLSLLQQLKEKSITRHIPVHVVSANDRIDAAMHLGAIGYAVKPTSREMLHDIFQKLEDKFTQKIKRVLLVEDDARQRDSVVQLISDEDIEITAVEFGNEALQLLRTKIFDCMIIDLKLPDMQGNQLLQRMSQEEICSFPPVIVYTGRNLTREEENDLLKYSRSIIIKGARSPERLLDEVTLFLHKVESQLSAERQTMLKTVRNRDRVFEGRRVLLVDDDVRNIFALTSVLEQKGLMVETARNGLEAISKLDTTSDIDLVLMDIMMPGMDGLEATRRVRADARFTKLPIIAITAKAMKDDQEQCLKAGANDYLAKPVDLDRLYSLLRVWLPNMERI